MQEMCVFCTEDGENARNLKLTKEGEHGGASSLRALTKLVSESLWSFHFEAK